MRFHRCSQTICEKPEKISIGSENGKSESLKEFWPKESHSVWNNDQRFSDRKEPSRAYLTRYVFPNLKRCPARLLKKHPANSNQ